MAVTPLVQPKSPGPTAQTDNVPELINGDSLSSNEFLRRYEGMPGLKKAELIKGTVFMGSPVSITHSDYDGCMQMWLRLYAARTPAVRHLINATLILDSENTFQPDALLYLRPKVGGKHLREEKKYLSGTPELVAEISVSSTSIDLRQKLQVYQRCGVQEYLVCLAEERQIKWFCLENQRYVEQPISKPGILESKVFPGLVLNLPAFLALNDSAVIATLQEGLASNAHAEFIKRVRR